MDVDAPQVQWHNLKTLLTRPGPFAQPYFEPGLENLQVLQEASRVLVVGAGGLGCEILKLLALSGFRDISVIDLDTIDISNLNRQFLFRHQHIGRYKAEVAAEAIMKKYPHVKVEYFTKRLQEFPQKWFSRFNVCIAGLDNVQARRDLNKTLNELVEFDADKQVKIDTVIPLIDGGTEGFRGQARVFLPKLTSCFECSLDSMPQNQQVHSCTLANVPRSPEHCIQYVHEAMWRRLEEFTSADEYKMGPPSTDPEADFKRPPKVPLDTDNVAHMSWIYKRAQERAAQYNIQGVTYKLTMQVVKNIIPAVASTNAVIAAQCVQEAVKFLSRSSQLLNNFMLFNGVSLVGCALHEYEKKPHCVVCRHPEILTVSKSITLAELRSLIESQANLPKPDISSPAGVLFLGNNPDAYQTEMASPVGTLFASGTRLTVTSGKQAVPVLVIFNDA